MSKKGFGKLLAGLGIGTVIGMAVAPKSGEEMRKDMKDKAKTVAKKIKDIDLEELKNNLVSDFDKFKEEIKDMDKDKAKKLAKEKGTAIMKKAEDLIEMAKEKGKPVYEKTAKDVKKKLSEILSDMSKKLED